MLGCAFLTLSSMKRGASSDFWGVVASVCGASAVAWLIGIESSEIPSWPLYVLIGVTVVSLYCLWASLHNWPPFTSDEDLVSGEHEHQLRNMARKLREQISQGEYPTYEEEDRNPDFLEAIFSAHFPQAHQLVAAFSEQTGEWRGARSQYFLTAGKSMLERFGEKDGWRPEELKSRFLEHQWSIADGRAPDLEEDDPSRSVKWDRKVVFQKPGITSIEVLHVLTSASIQLEDWVKELGRSEHAGVMLTALSRSRTTEAAAISALEPVIQHQPINCVKGCKICNPARTPKR
jgi:hypothetical protein